MKGVCEGCGAPLPAEKDGVITCTYCGRAHDPVTQKSQIHVFQLLAPRMGTGLGVVVAITVAVAGLAVAVASNMITSTQTIVHNAMEHMPPKMEPLPGATATVARSSEPRLLWDDVGGPAQIVSNGAEGFFIGRTREGDEDELYIRATNGDGSLRYKLGPFGTYGDNYRHVWFAVNGSTLAISDQRNRVGLYSVQDGVPLFDPTALTDQVLRLCPAGEGFRAESADRNHVYVDPTSGRATEAPAAPGCPERNQGPAHNFTRKNGGSAVRAPVPDVEGFKLYFYALPQGVAIGSKDPGTPTPKLVGWDPASGALRYQVWIPNVDLSSVRMRGSDTIADIDATSTVAVYPEGSDFWHATLFDNTSGTRLWDVKLHEVLGADATSQVGLGPNFVIVKRTSTMDILSRADGHQVGIVGEAYEEDKP